MVGVIVSDQTARPDGRKGTAVSIFTFVWVTPSSRPLSKSLCVDRSAEPEVPDSMRWRLNGTIYPLLLDAVSVLPLTVYEPLLPVAAADFMVTAGCMRTLSTYIPSPENQGVAADIKTRCRRCCRLCRRCLSSCSSTLLSISRMPVYIPAFHFAGQYIPTPT